MCWLAQTRSGPFPGLALAPHYHIKGNGKQTPPHSFTGAGEFGFTAETFPSPCLPLFLLPKFYFEFGGWISPETQKQVETEWVTVTSRLRELYVKAQLPFTRVQQGRAEEDDTICFQHWLLQLCFLLVGWQVNGWQTGRDTSRSRNQIAQQIKMLPEGAVAPSPLNKCKAEDSLRWFQSKLQILSLVLRLKTVPLGNKCHGPVCAH